MAMPIYLDHAATSPLRPELALRWQEINAQPLGNPSSLHRSGHRARMILEQAREQTANTLKCEVEEIVFMSGATEANNLALFGWMRQQPKGRRCLISGIEHPSVYDAALALRLEGYQVETIAVDQNGLLDLNDLVAKLDDQVALVSVMAINNEVGVVQPIEAIKEILTTHKALLHVDAVQTPVASELPNLKRIDFLSLSGHKLGAPVGCGMLYVRQGLRVHPLLLGGAQEDSRRAGTSNVVGSALFAESLQLAQQNRAQRAEVMLNLRQQLEAGLERIPGSLCLSQTVARSPHISSWLFDGISAETLLVRMDMLGVYASSGAACSSHSLEPSRTVKMMGFSDAQGRSLIRFSFSDFNTSEEIARAIEVTSQSIEQIRARASAS
jgi:cysteine desulfurase